MADKLMGVTGTRIADSKSYEAKETNKTSPVSQPKKNRYGV